MKFKIVLMLFKRYVIAVDDKIVPIEVKSGQAERLKSLHMYMELHKSKLGIKLSMDEHDVSGRIWSIPLYLVVRARIVAPRQ